MSMTLMWIIVLSICNISMIKFSLLLVLLTKVRGIEFPNTVVGIPRVDCQIDSIKLAVETSSGNPSHMFVKGRIHEPACTTRNNNMVLIKHESCGLTRERSLNPAGVYYKVCIVVQLHPQFITKVDRTFCASCFYMESVKEFTNELGVSVMSSTEVAVSFPMPTCTYTIRRGSANGAEIKFATVGEQVFHVWSCPSNFYGALVQNCFVDDGQGNRILIIDQNGCGVDRYIIQTPNYSDQVNMAWQESHVFKFADKMITRFTCQIKICVKAGNGCRNITPPTNCPLPTTNGRPGLPVTGAPSFTQYKYPAPFTGEPLTPQVFPPNPVQGYQPPPSVRPPYFHKSQLRNNLRNIRSLSDDGDLATGELVNEADQMNATFEHLYSDASMGNDFVDVVGELFVLEDVGQTSDRKLYEDILNAVANGTFKRQMRPENSVCMPTFGFAAILIIFACVLFGGLVGLISFVAKNRRRKLLRPIK